jgi:hypothetical protein
MGVIMYGLVSGCGLRAVTTTIHGGPVTAWAVLEFFFGLPKGVRLVVARCTFSLRCLWLSHFLSSFLSAFFHALLLRGISQVSLPKWRVNKTDAVLHRRQEKCYTMFPDEEDLKCWYIGTNCTENFNHLGLLYPRISMTVKVIGCQREWILGSVSLVCKFYKCGIALIIRLKPLFRACLSRKSWVYERCASSISSLGHPTPG